MDKLVHDAISERLGIDDSHIWIHKGEKVVDVEEFTEIVITEIE
jgi:Holliday junction resolvase RusA-like endonuclease